MEIYQTIDNLFNHFKFDNINANLLLQFLTEIILK